MVAALASRVAASEDEIKVTNPAAATASKTAPNIRVRIPHSPTGVKLSQKVRRLCFREASRSQAKRFVHGSVLGLLAERQRIYRNSPACPKPLFLPWHLECYHFATNCLGRNELGRHTDRSDLLF
jgi:hypothetical protein